MPRPLRDTDMPPGVDAPLTAVLERAQALGFIGGTDIDPHVDHALGFAAVLGPTLPATALDLGSGGGLPGLVLASLWPATSWWLVDASERRSRFLAEAVAELAWGDRVTIIRGRAEELARRPELRARMELVTARSFGSPAVTAECAAGFLTVGGRLIVSEPPSAVTSPSAVIRWPASGLAELNLEAVTQDSRQSGPGTYQVLRLADHCPDRYPRRVGIPAKRPLFG
jgi:16S rRNA (guanine527-N7)-methyltransferase